MVKEIIPMKSKFYYAALLALQVLPASAMIDDHDARIAMSLPARFMNHKLQSGRYNMIYGITDAALKDYNVFRAGLIAAAKIVDPSINEHNIAAIIIAGIEVTPFNYSASFLEASRDAEICLAFKRE